MTVLTQIQQQDVAVLKCIYFQLVKTFKEIMWYGLDCNLNSIIEDIEKGFTYLMLLETECEIPYQLQCEIKLFISRNSSYCIFTDTSCTSTLTIIPQSYLLSEANDILSTESELLILT